METETHPHRPFTPKSMKALIMGSFPGRKGTLTEDPANHWFYSAKRNQLWKILEIALETPLPDRVTKERVLTAKGIGIADILLKIKRTKPTNADQDLVIVQYNDQAIGQILRRYPTLKICFTSRFVEKQFKRCFPDYPHTVLLPSPSPRYARLSLAQKAAAYKDLLTT